MTNVWYVKNILANCDGNLYLSILHLPRVELHCKLQESLHRVTGSLLVTINNTTIILKHAVIKHARLTKLNHKLNERLAAHIGGWGGGRN